MGNPSLNPRRRWSSLFPLFVCLVVVAEIAFLRRLDMAKNAGMVQHWTTTFQFPSTSTPAVAFTDSFTLSSSSSSSTRDAIGEDGPGGDEGDIRCQDWLEREDDVPYARNFMTDPIIVSGAESQSWSTCSVGCIFGSIANRTPDATFNQPKRSSTPLIHRSMESSKYYIDNNIDEARRWVSKILS